MFNLNVSETRIPGRLLFDSFLFMDQNASESYQTAVSSQGLSVFQLRRFVRKLPEAVAQRIADVRREVSQFRNTLNRKRLPPLLHRYLLNVISVNWRTRSRIAGSTGSRSMLLAP